MLPSLGWSVTGVRYQGVSQPTPRLHRQQHVTNTHVPRTARLHFLSVRIPVAILIVLKSGKVNPFHFFTLKFGVLWELLALGSALVHSFGRQMPFEFEFRRSCSHNWALSHLACLSKPRKIRRCWNARFHFLGKTHSLTLSQNICS